MLEIRTGIQIQIQIQVSQFVFLLFAVQVHNIICYVPYIPSKALKMSVLTLVQRALPSSLPWKRRSSASSSSTKGKERELDPDYDYTSNSSDLPENPLPAEISIPASSSPPTPTSTRPLHRDVSRAHALHIAVKAGPDHAHPPHESKFGVEFEFESEFGSGSSPETENKSGPRSGTDRLSRVSRRSAFCRDVSWASIVRSRCRWTNEQERELVMAERQLARCQKAWSSEQELWLSYVCDSFRCLFSSAVYSFLFWVMKPDCCHFHDLHLLFY